MQKISMDKVCKQMYDRNEARLDEAFEQGRTYCPYTFEKFQRDMMADGFIASFPTVRSKWLAVLGAGLVVESEEAHNFFFDVRAMRGRLEAAKRVTA